MPVRAWQGESGSPNMMEQGYAWRQRVLSGEWTEDC